jgi:hypothetical protein
VGDVACVVILILVGLFSYFGEEIDLLHILQPIANSLCCPTCIGT